MSDMNASTRTARSSRSHPSVGFGAAIAPLLHWLLGAERITRQRVVSVGLCGLVYLACGLAAHGVADQALVKPWLLPVLLAVAIPANVAFLVLVRRGWTYREDDPALMVPQNILALLCISLAYVALRPQERGLVLGLLTLVIVFGMYTHTPRQALGVGTVAIVLLLGLTLLLSLYDPLYYPVAHELLRFELLAGTVPVLVYASNQLATWRQRLQVQREELTQALVRVQELATRDSLTGLYNRRHMQELLDASLLRLERYGERFCVALIDLDHFKRINDQHGHRCGDEVLAEFAVVAAGVLRESDVVARWGGEEFIMLFPSANPEQALIPLRRLKDELQGRVLSGLQPDLRLTFSAGVAVHAASASLAHTLERADAALYQAKAEGRDRVVVAASTVAADV
jgi:diguanylate cyclase (GGDEF)-like protein